MAMLMVAIITDAKYASQSRVLAGRFVVDGKLWQITSPDGVTTYSGVGVLHKRRASQCETPGDTEQQIVALMSVQES